MGVIDAPPTVQMAVVEREPVHVRPRRARRHGARWFVFSGAFLGLVLSAGLLAYEAGLPRPLPVRAASVELATTSLPGLGFSIDAPRRWTVVVDDLKTATFVDTDQPGATRGMRVVVDPRSMKQARGLLAKINGGRVSSYHPIDVVDGLELEGRPAFRHDFTGTDEVLQQWWVQRGKGTFRIEFWARPDIADEARALNDRIVRTFHER